MMKKLKFLMILGMFFVLSPALKAQYLTGTILKPVSGNGSPYWLMNFGQDWAGSWAGFMQNVNGPGHYGDGNDFTIYTYGNRDIVINPGGGKTALSHIDGSTVTIGTLNPEAGAKLTVKGKIACREVKVTATAGADFVFDEDYNLPKLLEVEKFVKENKHLPEIPKAVEMETEGYDMGEFQVKLLQKVEELTLYTIEQEKKLANQDELLKDQQRAIKELQEKLK